MTGWPEASLDPVRRARVLAAAIPGAGYAERVLDAPFAEAWPFLADLERSVATFDATVRRVRLTERADGSLRARVTTFAGVPWPFDVDLEEGWCLMRGVARAFVVVMAARPEGDRTRFAQIEAVPLPGGRLLRAIVQRGVDADGRGIERALARRRHEP